MAREFKVISRSTGEVLHTDLSRKQARDIARTSPDYTTNEYLRRRVVHGWTNEPEGSRFPSREFFRIGAAEAAEKGRYIEGLGGAVEALSRIETEHVVLAFLIKMPGEDVRWSHIRRETEEVEFILRDAYYAGENMKQFYRAVMGMTHERRMDNRTVGDWYDLEPVGIYGVVFFPTWGYEP